MYWGLGFGLPKGAGSGGILTPVILLAGKTVLETATIGTVVGTFGTLGTTGTPVFALTDTAGGKFTVVGAELRVAGALDYETAVSHNITVGVSGVAPDPSDRTFTIDVIDVTEVIGAFAYFPAGYFANKYFAERYFS